MDHYRLRHIQSDILSGNSVLLQIFKYSINFLPIPTINLIFLPVNAQQQKLDYQALSQVHKNKYQTKRPGWERRVIALAHAILKTCVVRHTPDTLMACVLHAQDLFIFSTLNYTFNCCTDSKLDSVCLHSTFDLFSIYIMTFSFFCTFYLLKTLKHVKTIVSTKPYMCFLYLYMLQ